MGLERERERERDRKREREEGREREREIEKERERKRERERERECVLPLAIVQGLLNNTSVHPNIVSNANPTQLFPITHFSITPRSQFAAHFNLAWPCQMVTG